MRQKRRKLKRQTTFATFVLIESLPDVAQESGWAGEVLLSTFVCSLLSLRLVVQVADHAIHSPSANSQKGKEVIKNASVGHVRGKNFVFDAQRTRFYFENA